MIKNIYLEDIVDFIKNPCIRKLRSYTEENYNSENFINTFKNNYNIFYKDKEKNFNFIENSNVISCNIDSINLTEDIKIKVSILILLYDKLNENENWEIKYINLFNEDNKTTISKSYIEKIENIILEALLLIENNNANNDLLFINNSCEFCNQFEFCKESLKDKIQSIQILTKADIKYLNKKNIFTLNELERFDFSEATESLKDKKSDIYKYLNHDNNTITLHDKYYLNWNNNDSKNYNEFLVSFQGHAKTDIVYSFNIKNLNDNNNEYILLTNTPNNKEYVLEHYKKIIEIIYNNILICHNNNKDAIFYILAPYEKMNFKKIIETSIKYIKEYDKDFINKLLFVSEYFGFEYHNKEFIGKIYINPFLTPLIDTKTLIEKYFVLPLGKYSFEEILAFILSEDNLDTETLNYNFKLSWALKPKLINDIWKNTKNEDILDKFNNAINYKLDCFEKLIKKVKEIIKNIQIIPDKIKFKEYENSKQTFCERFVIKEEVSTIKEYKQQFVDLPFDRLVEKGILLKCKITNEPKEKTDIYNNIYLYYSVKLYDYEYSTLINETYIEYFKKDDLKKDNFKNFVIRTFSFDYKLDLLNPSESESKLKLFYKNKKKFVYENKISVDTIYIAKSCYSNSQDSNHSNILENLHKSSIPNFESTHTEYTDDIYKSICNNKVTLLWGPPGTGKTHCIGTIVNKIIEENISIRNILISGFTHLSIDNCLNKICSFYNNKTEKVLFYKTKIQNDFDYNQNILELDHIDNLFYYILKTRHIVGSTIHQFNKIKINKKSEPVKFDLIIIDEASQLKYVEFLMVSNVIHENSKFLIVGDNKQLPPIIKNSYLNQNKKQILEAGSIFDFFDDDNKSQYVNKIQLTNCYRMNEVISDYPSNELYEGKLNPVNDVKNLTLNFGNNFNLKEDDYLSNILDPNYPVTLCLIKNNIPDSKNQKEATLVSDLCNEIYNLLEEKENINTDKKFLSVISPHNEHINLIKRTLKNKNSELENIFVNTVDKIQGQESDIVIVSYGVTDSLFAFKEKEFIYNYNRLNVCITRAKKKLILIISEELLDIDYRLVDDNNLKEHIEFIDGYIKYIKDNSKNIININNIEIYRIKNAINNNNL